MSWTETTQAIAAAVGAIGTPAAVWLGLRSMRLQRRQHDEEVHRALMRQPRSIVLDTSVREWPRVDGDGTYETVVATVVNHGEQTVYDVTLHWRYGATEEFGPVVVKGPLQPGERWDKEAPTSILHLAPFEEIGVYVSFYDTDSRGWAMTQRGRLVRFREAVDEGW